MARRPLTLVVLAAAMGATTSAIAASPFTATEMMRLKRLADPEVSPDGTKVAFAMTEVDLAAGTKSSNLWIVPLAGGEPHRLTRRASDETRPRFSPDGRRLSFLARGDGAVQVHVLSLEGGEPRVVTSFRGGVEAVSWIDERRLLVVARVFPACGADAACDAARTETAGPPSSARVYDRLPVRHWDRWGDGRRRHLLVVSLDGGGPSDLTPGPDDAPPFHLGGPDDFAVSPDGQEVCFSRKNARDEAWSTNANVWVVPSAGGQPKKVVEGAGYDGACRYSPDGRLLAWRAQKRAGYESDRWQLMVEDRASGAVRSLTPDFDRQVEEFVFSPDSRAVYFVAEDEGRASVFSVPAGGGPVTRVVEGGSFGHLAVLPKGDGLLATHARLTHPAEIVRFAADGKGLSRVTRVNDEVLAPFHLREGERVTYRGAEERDVQAWVVKPPDFDPARRYPLLVLVHGGPQGSWSDAWSYRWNPEVFASAGYVVFMPNPRGSVGWGQAFTDDINRDWGGKAYEDVMRGTDFAEALPYVNEGRTGAAGASYGGYLIDWIAGHTDRFRALVSHDGVFDLVSEYGATDELWFPEWEFGGTYWTNPAMYERWSPRAFVRNFKTPTLVVHGERDYRVPIEQGLAFFTALQRQGVPSRLLVFPDENHWVLKPGNSVRWYAEVIGWLDRWVKEAPTP
jgi:dipeptidyl aminopeptidase/acylaminoacyl peptidase